MHQFLYPLQLIGSILFKHIGTLVWILVFVWLFVKCVEASRPRVVIPPQAANTARSDTNQDNVNATSNTQNGNPTSSLPNEHSHENQNTTNTNNDQQNNKPKENRGQDHPSRHEYWADKWRQERKFINYLEAIHRETKEELHKERLKNVGLGQNTRPTLPAHGQKPLVHKHYELWKLVDIGKDFAILKDSIHILARELHWYSRHTVSLQNNIHIHGLSKSLKLIGGVSEGLWSEETSNLLQGAVWSILLDTVFSNDFEVFGIRATHFGQEIRHPHIEPQFASWRSLTAEKLLMRTGLVQYSSRMRRSPSENLRVLLGKDHSADDSLFDTLCQVSTSLEMKDASVLLADVDRLALQSIYNARLKFVNSLEFLLHCFGARRKLAGMVRRVVTDAQVVAIMMLCQQHIYQLITPTIGDYVQKEGLRQGSKTIEAITNPDYDPEGNIVFTVNPGFRQFDKGDAQQPKLLQSALVYVAGVPTNSNGSHVAAPQAQPSQAEVEDSVYHNAIAIAFCELKQIIDEFANTLQYKTEPDSLLKFLIDKNSRPNTSDIPSHWNQRTKDVYKTQTCIWNMLIKYLFENKFSCYSLLGDIHNSEWAKRYPGLHPLNPMSISTVANIWRHQKGWTLLQNLGGPSFLEDPRGATIRDKRYESSMKQIKDTICGDMRRFVNASCQPHSDTTSRDNAIEQIVLRAMLLALRMDIPRHHYKIWSPAYNATYTRPPPSRRPVYHLTNDCAHVTKGRITFVVYPGLCFYSAANLQRVETVVPPLTYVTEEGTGNDNPPPTSGAPPPLSPSGGLVPSPLPTPPPRDSAQNRKQGDHPAHSQNDTSNRQNTNYRRPYVESVPPSATSSSFHRPLFTKASDSLDQTKDSSTSHGDANLNSAHKAASSPPLEQQEGVQQSQPQLYPELMRIRQEQKNTSIASNSYENHKIFPQRILLLKERREEISRSLERLDQQLTVEHKRILQDHENISAASLDPIRAIYPQVKKNISRAIELRLSLNEIEAKMQQLGQQSNSDLTPSRQEQEEKSIASQLDENDSKALQLLQSIKQIEEEIQQVRRQLNSERSRSRQEGEESSKDPQLPQSLQPQQESLRYPPLQEPRIRVEPPLPQESIKADRRATVTSVSDEEL
ncbi:hypothetical protein DM02DRAFT_728660 [Periconia macrospinosa]|uniref:Uncharacterized protein n=1 Tax=Periconia macrospinosa TaxID=97972 RepID=A0A2V1DR50_9PLEO|nr:hypothetical protein DM02DRAFT_728660 [Periconia macrospinosa]